MLSARFSARMACIVRVVNCWFPTPKRPTDSWKEVCGVERQERKDLPLLHAHNDLELRPNVTDKARERMEQGSHGKVAATAARQRECSAVCGESARRTMS